MQIQETITIDGVEYPYLRDATPEEQAEAEKLQNELELETLKRRLAETDYKAIKYAEGWYSQEEYAPLKAERQIIRDRINRLEEENE
ncbi:MAG: hypothetical protein IK057_06595 [Clostridia bacterium]|nr:hypothetical protein [Clostridia bacterium]